MKRRILWGGALLLVLPGLAAATDYPLAFKTLDAQKAVAFTSGSTTYAMIQAGKPPGLVKAPRAVSQHPLYGTIATGTDQLLFRLDESKGNGRGYDQMIVDLNRNGDLTGDPVVGLAPSAGGSKVITTPQQLLFGPIQAPENLKIGADRPVFYAQVYLFMTPGAINSLSPNSTVGELMVRPGWYLEAKVEVAGKRHTVDLVDADCNFRIGDPERPTIYRTGLNGSASNYWLFQGGDRYLVDWDGKGGVASTILESPACPFGPVLYLDAKPYKATLSADSSTLSLDPWPEPLAELALQHSEQISRMQLAWEKAPGDWMLLAPGVADGKAQVPPGNYRLYSVQMKAKTARGESLLMTGTKRAPDGDFKAVAGASTPLPCGAPLQINLTAKTSHNTSSGVTLGILPGQSGPAQVIQATILGAGGETYSIPYLTSGTDLRTPPGPTFAVLTAEGKPVDNGSLEYG